MSLSTFKILIFCVVMFFSFNTGILNLSVFNSYLKAMSTQPVKAIHKIYCNCVLLLNNPFSEYYIILLMHSYLQYNENNYDSVNVINCIFFSQYIFFNLLLLQITLTFFQHVDILFLKRYLSFINFFLLQMIYVKTCSANHTRFVQWKMMTQQSALAKENLVLKSKVLCFIIIKFYLRR